jgi:hypothetical protein
MPASCGHQGRTSSQEPRRVLGPWSGARRPGIVTGMDVRASAPTILIRGEQLGPGAYVHIPSGVQHDIDATDTDGCSVFYLYDRYGA